ncbi:unnamed protein product [Ectocarpus sp. CCAP 1310/34]|nr:unnamed protein product [Ectocarpus sp. CCAP 1310/34]
MSFFVLYESASGYALLEVIEAEEVGSLLEEVQQAVLDPQRFCRTVKLKGFQPFTTAENALENVNAISEQIVTDDLKNFLEMNLPKVKKSKSASFQLGCIEPGLASAIQDRLGFPCRSDETVKEIIRGIRVHFHRFVKELDGGVGEKAQLGLGHSYSRAKVKMNPARSDNMIIQSICLLDQLDKDLNTFAMRVREWYCWHFPELRELVKDNYMFARCAAYIKDRAAFDEENLPGLNEIVMDEELAAAILKASRHSMGMDASPVDMSNIVTFCERMVKLAEYRRDLYAYLVDKMGIVAPNLAALIGDTVGARLISKAGSLTSLAKCPASTVQILGAEKALFRALKTKGNTPKYGIIYHSTFIGRAAAKNKGRISRVLANKCAIASRIDSFSDEPSTKYGDELREQVEERLKFYDTGEAPRKNISVMEKVAAEIAREGGEIAEVSTPSSQKKKKKRERKEEDEDAVAAVDDVPSSKKKKKKKKKSTA